MARSGVSTEAENVTNDIIQGEIKGYGNGSGGAGENLRAKGEGMIKLVSSLRDPVGAWQGGRGRRAGGRARARHPGTPTPPNRESSK